MNKLRLFLLAGLALALSAGITVVAYRFIQRHTNPGSAATRDILVASRQLSLGDRITESDIQRAPWSEAIPIAGSFSDPERLVGRGVIVPMQPNEPILESKVAPLEAGAGMTPAIPDGMRAVAVKVNDVIGVAGFALPGTRVDIIVTGDPQGQNKSEVSKVVLENVQVLAAGQNLEQKIDGKPENVQVITLLVTPEDSQKLALAAADGRIQLALRNPLDLARNDPDPVSKRSLYTSSSSSAPVPPKAPPVKTARKRAEAPPPAAPSPAPPQVVQVELIQGGERETFEFKVKAQ